MEKHKELDHNLESMIPIWEKRINRYILFEKWIDLANMSMLKSEIKDINTELKRAKEESNGAEDGTKDSAKDDVKT